MGIIFKVDGPGVLVELHGLLFDIFLFGIALSLYDFYIQKKLRLERFIDELDDYRGWDGKEASLRIKGLLQRIFKEFNSDRNFVGLRQYFMVKRKAIDLSDMYLNDCIIDYDLSFSGDKIEFTKVDFLKRNENRDAILVLGDANYFSPQSALHHSWGISGEVSNCTFISCKFKKVDFKDLIFRDCNFFNCKFEGSNFHNCTFEKTHFELSYLSDVLFENCAFWNATLNPLRKRVAKFEGCSFKFLHDGTGDTLDGDIDLLFTTDFRITGYDPETHNTTRKTSIFNHKKLKDALTKYWELEEKGFDRGFQYNELQFMKTYQENDDARKDQFLETILRNLLSELSKEMGDKYYERISQRF